MRSSPPNASSHDTNCFDFIRLVAAFLVFFSHTYALAGKGDRLLFHPPIEAQNEISIGTLGVSIFFAISGFLVTGSFYRRGKSLKQFFISRALRIYPAYIVNGLFVMLIIGGLATTLAAPQYYALLFQNMPLYLEKMALFSSPVLPGVFQANPFHLANGSLWTLQLEVPMYVFIAFALICQSHFSKPNFQITLLLICCAVLIGIIPHVSGVPQRGVMHCITFILGSLLYLCRSKIPFRFPILLGGIFLLVLSHGNLNLFIMLYCPVVAYGTIYIAFVPSLARICHLSAGDFSYGVYIYAYPLQQYCYGLFPHNFPAYVLLSLALTITCAVISWHFVEKKALSIKPRRPAGESHSDRPASLW